MNNWLIRALLYSHHEVDGNVSQKCRKTDEISLEAQFCQNQTKHITTKNLRSFWKIFDEFSVSYWQTDLMATEFEVHTAFGRSIRIYTDLGLTNQIASFSLVIQ